MSKPIVAIVGRPNVGKSTLFNALAGEKISIVKDTPGVTRDRIYADVSWLDYNFTIIDTGGIEPESDNIILKSMREQAEIAIETADVIIFMTDVRQGLVDDDHKVVQMLRKSKKPVILVVNKVDSFEKYMNDVYEFYNLGLGDPVPISGASRLGIGDILDEVVSHFDEESKNEEEDDRPRIAIIGKPNVGKSSIINKLLGENRVIVSDIAGTTRDAIDTEIVRNGTEYVFIDTAGLRRKSKIKEDIERYSIIRTVSAVERCNVAVLVIDATEGITDQDAKIAGIAHERGKGMIIVVNKWDAVEKDDKTIYKFTKEIREKLSYMPYAELLFVSAATGQRLPKLFETIDAVIENHSLRVATGVLNEIMTEAVAMQQPPTDKGKRLKLFYITQVAVKRSIWFPGNTFKIYYQGEKRKIMLVLARIICLVGGYFFGIIQTSYIYGKLHGIDIREYGSGNAGTTNALRVLGKKAGAVVFLGDLFKSVIACSITHIIMNALGIENVYLFVIYTAAGVVLGHNFPFYMQFKGGKGIAATSGIAIGLLDWRVALIELGLFVFCVVVTKYVSVGSICLVLGLLVSYTIFAYTGSYGFTSDSMKLESCIVLGLITLLAIYRHKQNIVRLIKGTENKFSLKGRNKTTEEQA